MVSTIEKKKDQILSARLEEAHAGDRLVLMVELGVDELFKKVLVRLHGVDTPDAYKRDAHTEAGKIRDEVRSKLKNRPCRIEVHAEMRKRWIVTLWYRNDDGEFINLNEELRSRGFIYQGRSD